MFLFLFYSCFCCVVNITGYLGHRPTPRFGFRCGMHNTLIATNKNTKAIVYTKMLLCATTLCGDFLRPRYVFLACQHPPCRKGVKSQKTACGCPCGGVEKIKETKQKTTERRFGQAVRREAGKQRDLGSNLLQLPFSSNVVVCGHCLGTLSLTINETLKWLSSLPTIMQKSY